MGKSIFPKKKTLEYIFIGLLLFALICCTMKIANPFIEGFDDPCGPYNSTETCGKISGDTPINVKDYVFTKLIRIELVLKVQSS